MTPVAVDAIKLLASHVPATELNKLMKLGELSAELKNHGVIERDRCTLWCWCTTGIDDQSGSRVVMRSQRMGKDYLATIAWVIEFIYATGC